MILPEYFRTHICYYHLDAPSGIEVRTDGEGEWDDVMDLLAAGALHDATVHEGRKALVFPTHIRASEALEELRSSSELA